VEEKMTETNVITKVGSGAFLIGIIIALILGLIQAWGLETTNQIPLFSSANAGPVAWVLAIIGIIIGLLAVIGKGTITPKEVPSFLLAGIALVVMYGVFRDIKIDPYIGSLFSGISLSLAIFVAPVVGILAIKTIWDLGKDV
jgi:hypothetical protein